MTEPRLASDMLVKALCRLTEAAGGFAMVLRKGDAGAGAILVQTLENGRNPRLLERMPGWGGPADWTEIWSESLENKGSLAEYLARRTARDPDIWLIELDIADQQRLTGLLVEAR